MTDHEKEILDKIKQSTEKKSCSGKPCTGSDYENAGRA